MRLNTNSAVVIKCKDKAFNAQDRIETPDRLYECPGFVYSTNAALSGAALSHLYFRQLISSTVREDYTIHKLLPAYRRQLKRIQLQASPLLLDAFSERLVQFLWQSSQCGVLQA